MLIRISFVAALVASATYMAASPTYAADLQYEYVCTGIQTQSCRWVMTATSGGQQSQQDDSAGGTSSAQDGVGDPDPCYYRQLAIQPPPGDSRWGGHDATAGRLWQAFCPDSLKIASRQSDGSNVIGSISVGDPYYVGDSDSPDSAFAGIDPMVLVSRARGAFELPTPEPSFGPSPGELAVKIPVWFSVPDFAPVVQTATAGRYTATVTAELTQTEWLPGEPDDPNVFPQHAVPPVLCTGSGTPFQAGMNPGDPPCGYTYIWQSLKDRTDGLGRWILQVTSRYQVTFDVTNTQTGEVIRSGSDTVATEARVLMPIREWHGILGDPNAPAPENQPLYPETFPAADGTPH